MLHRCALSRSVFVAVGSSVLVTILLAAWQWRRQTVPVDESLIVVPGGGLTLDGNPTPWVRRRLEEAARIYHERRKAGEACRVVTLSLGTPHKPMPVDPKSHFQVMEAEASARCLIREFGLNPEHVFEENWSLDTVGNAYMLRAGHTDPAGWNRLVVVNNEFHMQRTRLIFEKVFALEPQPTSAPYLLDFVEVPNQGLEGEVLAARKAREAKSAAGFVDSVREITSMRQMHEFVFSKHMAYASKRLVKDRQPVDVKALQTY